MGYTQQGVDLEKFKKEALNGCYAQPGKTYGQDYAYHLLGKYLYFCNDVQTKRTALLNTNMASIAQKIQQVLEDDARSNPLHQQGYYLSKTKNMLENIRKPLIEYRDALERLYRCCLKMDVDKNTGNKLGVLDYTKFYTWSQAAFAELVGWERSSNSIGGSRALKKDINCGAYAAGVNKQWDGTPMVTWAECQVAEDLCNQSLKFGLQIPDVNQADSYSTYQAHYLSSGFWELQNLGFDVKSHPITAENYGPDFAQEKLPLGYHRVFLMTQLSEKSTRENFKHFDFHWARLDEDGHWSDKPGEAPVSGEQAGVNPTKMNPYLDGYSCTFRTFCKPLGQGEDTNIPWGTVNATFGMLPYMPVAYYDICDKDRYSMKYKQLQNQWKAFESQRRKQLVDALRCGTPEYQPSAEANKMPKEERYKVFGELGKQFCTDGQITDPDSKYGSTTQKLQKQQNRARAVPAQLRACVQDAESKMQQDRLEKRCEELESTLQNPVLRMPVPMSSLGNPMGTNPMMAMPQMAMPQMAMPQMAMPQMAMPQMGMNPMVQKPVG